MSYFHCAAFGAEIVFFSRESIIARSEQTLLYHCFFVWTAYVYLQIVGPTDPRMYSRRRLSFSYCGIRCRSGATSATKGSVVAKSDCTLLRHDFFAWGHIRIYTEWATKGPSFISRHFYNVSVSLSSSLVQMKWCDNRRFLFLRIATSKCFQPLYERMGCYLISAMAEQSFRPLSWLMWL